MKNRFVFATVLFAVVPSLLAQDPAGQKPGAQAQEQMPAAKRAEHEALKGLVGTWDSTVKMAARPGVPGMEKAAEMKGIERAELICDGVWLKWTIDGSFQGQPFQGLWLAGYDPFQESYVGIWVDNHEAAPSELTGAYDAENNSWTWRGTNAQGETRSELVFDGADTIVETAYLTPSGGDEVQVMEITRKRIGAAAPVPAAMITRTADGTPEELRELQRGVGEWQAEVAMVMDPSQPAVKEQATESVRSICAGKYTWSDFNGSMMGMPFEGHSVCGYDAEAGEYVSYWIDSMSPVWSMTRGSLDSKSKTITMQGDCVDCDGKPMSMTQVMSWKDDDTRLLHMEFVNEQGTQQMDITYERTSKN